MVFGREALAAAFDIQTDDLTEFSIEVKDPL